MATLLRRHTTLAAFSLSLAASTAFVACGSDDSTTTNPGVDSGVDSGAGNKSGSGGSTGTGGKASGGAANTGGKSAGGASAGGASAGGASAGGASAGGATNLKDAEVTSNGDAQADAMN